MSRKEQITNTIYDYVKLFHTEDIENASEKEVVFLELDYTNLNETLIDLNNIELFNSHFRKFFQLVERQLEKEYGKKFILKVIDYPKSIPFNHIHSKHVGKIYSTVGMIKTITQFKLKLKSVLYRCKRCEREVRMNVEGEHVKFPVTCPDCGGKQFEIIFEDSTYDDFKYLKLEEPLESRGNKKFVEFKGTIEGYLASPFYNLQAGDVCNIIFELKPQLNKKNNTLDTVLDIWHIKPVNNNYEEIELSDEDFDEIFSYATREDILELFARSLASEVVGYDDIKKGLVLQMFSGGPNAAKPRDNIHCLIIGDPGLGKSLMLNNVSEIAPKVIKTNGAATTKAGITASAIRNELTGAWELEAGASVLSDKGMLIIDEFDKLNKSTMLSLNEPMEDLTVSVSKANIQQTLSANTTVLAGANPKNSKFDIMKEIGEQINIPASLLSRFDLIYALTDEINYDNDLDKAHKILTGQYSDEVELLDKEFMKKYISYAKNNEFPTLSEEAVKELETFYAKTRQLANTNDSKPITTRELQAMRRLATAHAKMRLSPVVEAHDAKVAIEVYTNSLATLGLDFNNVGSIQNILSKNERNIVFFMERLLSDGSYGEKEILEMAMEEYDLTDEKAGKLYDIAKKNN